MNELSKEDKARFEFASDYYARVAKGEVPKWQCRGVGSSRWGEVLVYEPFLYPEFEYRLAPKTITINGVEVVAPRLSERPVDLDKHVYTAGVSPPEGLPTKEAFLSPGCFVYDNHEDLEAFRAAVVAAIQSRG